MLTEYEVQIIVFEIVQDNLSDGITTIKSEQSISDNEFFSEMLAHVEDEFDIEFSIDDEDQIKTVGDLVDKTYQAMTTADEEEQESKKSE